MTAETLEVVRLPERRRSHLVRVPADGRLELVQSQTARLRRAVRDGMLSELIAAERKSVDDRSSNESNIGCGDVALQALDRGGALDQRLCRAMPDGALGEASDVDDVDAPLDTAAASALNASGCGSHRPEYRWFCVQTHPLRELEVFERLRDQRFIAFLPLDHRERRRRVRGTRRSAIAEAVISPFFARYLFVAFDPSRDAWGAVRSTLGVSGLISLEQGKPAPLPRGWVDRAILRCDDEGVLQLEGRKPRPAGLARLANGDRVEIIGGAFHEFDALVLSSSKARVKVLLSLFGRQTEIYLRRDQVLSRDADHDQRSK